MKKFNKILLIAFVAFIALAIVACGGGTGDQPDEPVKYTVTFQSNGGSAVEPVEVEKNRTVTLPTPTKSGFDFEGWYLEETFNTEFTSSDRVTKDITLYAKWEEQYVEPATRIVVYTVSPREEFVLFGSNKEEKQNQRTEFLDRNGEYLVGDDNAWVVKPVVSFIELDVETGELVDAQPVVNSWEYEITLALYDDANQAYDAVVAADYVDHIDTENCTIDFAEAAVGKKFKVSIVPAGLTENQQQNVDKYTVSFECAVEDGYNAYTALDLAYYENRGTEESESGKQWVEFKQEKGLDVNYAPAAIFLHDNIEIKVSDLPEYFFYTKEEVAGASDAARAEGSLKDNKNIYLRMFNENETFHLCGNYYTLSAASIPVVVRENDEITEEGAVISHTALFRLETRDEEGNDLGSSAKFTNLNLVGNAPRVEDAIKSGGLLMNKTENVTFDAYNNIAYAWFIVYMPNATDVPYTVDSCKAYDSYNSLVYNWGSPYFYIKNSELIGAGGPVIIQDHINVDDADGGTPARTYVTNSKLESYVAGTEGWFHGVGAAALVPGITAMDKLFNTFGRSFLKQNADGTVHYFNLICVNKSGSAETITAQKIKGSLKIDDHSAFDFGETNPYLAAMLDVTFEKKAPAFQTSKSSIAGGYAFATGTGLFDTQNQQIIDPTNAIYQGEYLCLYFNGMALTFGFNAYVGGYEVYE